MAHWADPDFFSRQSARGGLLSMLKQQFAASPKSYPTRAGLVVLLLCVALIAAAYNTANNILYLTLSLIVSSVLLSWMLAWVNGKGVSWRLKHEPHFRAGELAPVCIRIKNGKRMIPTYSVFFNLKLTNAGKARRMALEDALPGGGETELEWLYEPAQRGGEKLRVAGLETHFPFGFFRRVTGPPVEHGVVVWPRRIKYTFKPPAGRHARQQGSALRRPGGGAELINLRNYTPGDSQRMVHWKATARTGRLMVRQTSEETQEAYLMFIETPARLWQPGEQFERLCGFAATLAEDLYIQGRLWGVAINDEDVVTIQRLADLHHVLDRLARLAPVETYKPLEDPSGHTLVTFQPGDATQVNAYVGGNKAGTA